jgi:hypothetical protein
MTWRVCSPPWPGRENPGSWPRRRQCGLPSAGPSLRSASHPLPGDPCTDGPGGLGHHPVPEPSWPRRWSSQWPGWAASSRPTRTRCPAPFSRWPTSRWRRRPRIAPARYRPPPHRERDTLMSRSSRPAGRAPDLATRPAPLSTPARRRRRERASRHTRYRPVTAPAAPLQGTRRFRRRRHRTIPIRRSPGPRRRPARASSRGPQVSPPWVRTLPDRCQPGSSAMYQRGVGMLRTYAQIVTTEA